MKVAPRTPPVKPTAGTGEGAARRLPIGAECTADGRVHFRVWATPARRVEVVPEGGAARVLAAEGNGYSSGAIELGPGTRYRSSLDGAEPRPDPVARFQPAGPFGPSEVVDPDGYEWPDTGWRGPALERPGGAADPPRAPQGARHMLRGLIDHLDEFGVGSIAEIFDAEAQFTPKGCIAQAWSVAETLRCLRQIKRLEAARK